MSILKIAHMGHPWMDDTIVLIRKQPHVYADVSALYYRPWQFYNALITAVEYGAAHGALAMTTPGDTSMATLNEVERVMKGGGARVAR